MFVCIGLSADYKLSGAHIRMCHDHLQSLQSGTFLSSRLVVHYYEDVSGVSECNIS